MKIPKPVRDMLSESIVYRSYQGQGDWNKPQYGNPVSVNKVRIDRTPVYSASTAGKALLYNAVVFCYDGLTSPLPDFKEESIVEFDGVEHIITKVIMLKEPHSERLFGVELVVGGGR